MNNQSCMVRSTLIDLNSDELYCYPFIICLDSCDNSCYTGEDPFDRICVSKKTKTVTLKVFDKGGSRGGDQGNWFPLKLNI